MNYIIIDDKVSSKILEEFALGFSSLNLVGTFSDSASAINHLSKQHNIDLAFVDINLAGPDFLPGIGNLVNPPEIIVLSSTVPDARNALNYNVLDFLIKPVNYSRFTMAVNRAISLNLQKSSVTSEESELFVRGDSSLVKLRMKDIIYIEAVKENASIRTLDKEYPVHYNLDWIEKQFPSEIFIRVHRLFIVNKRLITSLSESSLELVSGDMHKNLPVDRSFSPHLMNIMNVMAGKNLFTFSQRNSVNLPFDLYGKLYFIP